MVSLNYKNKRAFSIVETLVGFLLFSSMMMLYLPAFYTEMTRVNQHIETSEKWQLFYDLSKISLDNSLGSDLKNNFTQEVIDNWEVLHKQSVVSFSCDTLMCSLAFEDGSELIVEIQSIT